jgi:hypothetical protein
MLRDGEKPIVGSGGKMLGVRTDGYDIPIGDGGIVRPRTGGLSVAPEWRLLPFFLIPRRLKDKVKEARGSNKLSCFRLAEVRFEDTKINDDLDLRPDSPDHGTIEPARDMTLGAFQQALGNTRDSWTIEES